MQEVIVDLCCGTKKVSGATGIDRMAHPGVNIICHFEQSLPLKSNSVDAPHASHLLEHISSLIVKSIAVIKKSLTTYFADDISHPGTV